MAADARQAPPATDALGSLFRAEAEHVTRQYGSFRVYVADDGGAEHIVLVRGEVRGRERVLCRVSSACVMSTALDSAECDCVDQVNAALQRIASDERGGVLIYLTNQEGRGHGVTWKIRALRHKNDGADTFEAVERLGLLPDVRDYKVVPQILDELGVRSVALLSNNPRKRDELCRVGVNIAEMHALEVCPPRHAWRHMEAKRRRGHTLTNAYMDTGEIRPGNAAGGRRGDGWMPAVTATLVPTPPSTTDTIAG